MKLSLVIVLRLEQQCLHIPQWSQYKAWSSSMVDHSQ